MGWRLDRSRREWAEFRRRWHAEANATGLSLVVELGRFLCQFMPYTMAHTLWLYALGSVPFVAVSGWFAVAYLYTTILEACT